MRSAEASSSCVVSIAGGELGQATWSADALLAVGYLIVIGSLVGFTAYVWLLRVAPVSFVATYAYVNPIVAVALGWLLLGETITLADGRRRRGHRRRGRADPADERSRGRARAWPPAPRERMPDPLPDSPR